MDEKNFGIWPLNFISQIHSYYGNLTVYVKFSGDGEELSAEENPLLIISGNGLTLQYNKELSIISDQEQVFF